MKIGMICRMDNSGLGTMSWEYARHLKPHKILLIDAGRGPTFPERYEDFNIRIVTGMLDSQDISWLLDDIDIFFTIETPYNWKFVTQARAKGVKSVLYTMYEMSPPKLPAEFDYYLCPSELDKRYFPLRSTIIKPPVALDRLKYEKRTIATTFIHTASHGGVSGRKGTQLFLDAIPLVKNPNAKFKIFTWKPFTSNDPRVTIEVVNFKNYWQAWREGDVLVYPQDYNGMCLPIQEAMASGLAVISTDIFPFNTFLHKDLLFKPESMYKTRCAPSLNETDAAKITPESIAEKIDSICGKDISEYSLHGLKWSEQNSWDKLYEEYENHFLSLVQEREI